MAHNEDTNGVHCETVLAATVRTTETACCGETVHSVVSTDGGVLRGDSTDQPPHFTSVSSGLGSDTLDAFDESAIQKEIARVVRHYGTRKSFCIAIDCGERVELRAKHGDLPRSFDVPRVGDLLVKCSVIRKFPMVVGDASKDERFANDPLVQGDAAVRFFVGVPLISRTYSCIGLLCMMSSDPMDTYFSYDDCRELILASEKVVDEYDRLVGQRERAAYTAYTLEMVDYTVASGDWVA